MLTATSTFTGPTTVSAGRRAVNGALEGFTRNGPLRRRTRRLGIDRRHGARAGTKADAFRVVRLRMAPDVVVFAFLFLLGGVYARKKAFRGQFRDPNGRAILWKCMTRPSGWRAL